MAHMFEFPNFVFIRFLLYVLMQKITINKHFGPSVFYYAWKFTKSTNGEWLMTKIIFSVLCFSFSFVLQNILNISRLSVESTFMCCMLYFFFSSWNSVKYEITSWIHYINGLFLLYPEKDWQRRFIVYLELVSMDAFALL